ncbi:MAG: 23S rRNA (pseudouridine(1915)-N(3))-methyltransferase RlmH [Candidatus Saccharimonadales bacterium]
MKQITIISVGKKPNEPTNVLIESYQKRLESKFKIDWVYINFLSGKMSKAEQIQKESELIKARINKQTTILLDERGQQVDNEQLSQQLSKLHYSSDHLVFIIGGAYGVSEELRSICSFVWSLSRLVFPHQLVRLLLIEQIYRSQTIVDGQPYHHQ